MFRRKAKDIEPLFIGILGSIGNQIYHLCRVFYPYDRHSRDNLYNEILVHLWLHLEDYEFREGVDINAWAMKVARNKALSQYRKERVIRRLFSPLMPSNKEIIDEENEYNSMLEQLYSLIEMLPPLEKMIVDLYLQKRSYTEIAEITGLTATNVATKISRIKKKLKKMNDETEA